MCHDPSSLPERNDVVTLLSVSFSSIWRSHVQPKALAWGREAEREGEGEEEKRVATEVKCACAEWYRVPCTYTYIQKKK